MATISSDFKRTALVLVDMQNAFFEDPELKIQQKRLVGHCNDLVAAARGGSMPVFNVRTIHKRDKSTWTLSMLDDDQGFLFEGTMQTYNVSGLDTTDSIEIIKHRDSSFWGTDLLNQLHRRHVDSVVISGVSSHTCVAATASDAYAADIRAALAIDAIASADPDFANTTLALLKNEYRQKLETTAALLEQIPAWRLQAHRLISG
ncbi:cysteine hydrolase family protein [Paeniglutamicibacter sp. Y32M11]|jgi:nicotinamidase-related amidase|uniref:cysteine hydrolase family protein n=1 Tax=Paeniglutamicibacter sp. Y32M11 TaxID=2853258 RepID=UPI001052625C|nr:cysteine hydrolase [Paeniglutamicibacter sp. Y32M11]QXQ11963.1 cysteine hydrolase [Paeniglutamicibacter sp. Y32M11]